MNIIIRHNLITSSLAIVFLGLSAPVLGENLIDIYRLALDNDPTYRAGFHQKNASSEVYNQARALLLPTINFESTHTDTESNVIKSDNTVYNLGQAKYKTYEDTWSVDLKLIDFGNWFRIGQAKAKVGVALYELEDVRQDLILRVAESYFGVLAQQESLEFVRAEMQSVKKHFDLVKAKHKDGLARISELADAESRYMQVVADEVAIQNDLADSKQAIKEITGQAPLNLQGLSRQLRLASPKPAVIRKWIDLAFEHNPRVIRQRKAIKVARSEVKRQYSDHLPTLDLAYTQSKTNTGGSLYGGGSEVENEYLVFSLNVPIFAGGATYSKGKEAAALHNKAKEELVKEMRAVERETQAAYQGIVGAIARVNALKKTVDAQMLAVKTKRTSYESGLATTLSVLDAERDLYMVRRDYAQARYDYIIYTLKLKRAVGSIAEKDIHAVSAWLSYGKQGVLRDAPKEDETAVAIPMKTIVNTLNEPKVGYLNFDVNYSD